MNPIKSITPLSHDTAKEALHRFLVEGMIENIDQKDYTDTGASEDHILQWIEDWPAKLSPNDFVNVSSDKITPSIDALNAICLAHKFTIHAIRFFALEKGTHIVALQLQPLLAREIYLCFCKREHKLDLVFDVSDTLLNYLSVWSTSLGSKGSKTIDSIADILLSKDDISEKLNTLKSNISTVFSRLEKTRSKLVGMVEGQLTRQESQQQCGRAIREAAQQKNLTETCAKFLSGPWYDAIQHTYLTEGDRSSVWKKSLSITNELSVLFSQGTDFENINIEKISEIKSTLKDFLDPNHTNDAKHLKWLDDIETEFWTLKKDLGVEFNGELKLPNIDIGDSLELNISEKLIRKAKSYIEGDWFRFSGNYSGRSQILAISKHGHRYIFNNLNGQKTFDFSIKEFAYLIANGHASAIKEADISDALLEKLTTELIRKSLNDKKQKKAIDEEQKIKAKQKAIAEAEEIKKREEEFTKQQEEKLKQEKLLEQQKEDEKQKKINDNEKSELEEKIRLLEVEKQVMQMDLGHWISFNQEGERVKQKLAVKLSSSNKYVFTNELGLGRHEYKVDDLVAKIVSNDIQLHLHY